MSFHIHPADVLASKLAAKIDAEVFKALDDALGAGSWTMDAIKTRLTKGGFKNRWLFLDGRPLIAIDYVEQEHDWLAPAPAALEVKVNVTRCDWKPARA